MAPASEEKKAVIEDSSGINLMSLPTELHLLISKNLTYPDALSLKHTNQHFHDLVYTGVNLKIEWLIERRTLHLDCPHDKGCELGSDRRFCRGSVKLLMERRRQHGECEARVGGRGCLVLGTPICEHRKREQSFTGVMRKWAVWMTRHVVLWWFIAALAGVSVGLALGRIGVR